MNLIDVTKKFATPEACNDFIETMRWPDGVACNGTYQARWVAGASLCPPGSGLSVGAAMVVQSQIGTALPPATITLSQAPHLEAEPVP